MGLELLAAAAFVTSVYSAKQNRDYQVKSGNEQRASNAAAAAKERRQQIREERIRRATILQSSENSDVQGSSGESGALGSLSTQLGSNIGFNLGQEQSANNISLFQQHAADWQAIGQIAQQAGSMFAASANAPAPKKTT